MLQFYANAACTIPVTSVSPKRILALTKGQVKHTSLWLADLDTSTVSNYLSNGNLQVFALGSDLGHGVNIALKRSDQTSYAYPGFPVVFPLTQLQTGLANALQVDLEITVAPGAAVEFTQWALQSSNLYGAAAGIFVIPGGAQYVTAVAPGYINRFDYGLETNIRLMPPARAVKSSTPGFIFGEYRWRDEKTRNATALVPTTWNGDPEEIGVEKFIAGIGQGNDLEPVELVEIQDSIFMRLRSGYYYTGPHGYYLPANFNLEFVESGTGNQSHTLAKDPRQQRPLFVGTYRLDSQGFYERDTVYRYAGKLTNPDGTPRTDLPSKYFTLDYKTNILHLNVPMDPAILYLGTLSGQPVDYFDLPVYPVNSVKGIFIDRGLDQPRVYGYNFSFDRERGTLVINAPSGVGSSVPTGLKGEAVYAIVDPAVAILYETDTEDTRVIDSVDLNPAFSGLAGGYFYLQHRRQRPVSLTLACDKPRIDIPASVAASNGLVAFGPVYFEDDYALLKVTAYGSIPGETVPNARLQVRIDNTFTGLLNYQDPLSSTVEVITGGDGSANLIYIPKQGFGYYIPTVPAGGGLAGRATTSIANDTLVLPTPVPISQIRNSADGWLVGTYFVRNNNPLFGSIGADPNLGEIDWATRGTIGTIGYRTNGMRDAWHTGASGFDLVRPIRALDSNGVNYDQGGFLGTVTQLVFSTTVPLPGTVGAYFISFLQRVSIQLQLEQSQIFSNVIMLEMAVPELILENPFLIIEDVINGRLNQFRLGYVRGVNRGI